MQTKFLIIGNFLGRNIVGLTRLGYEYLRQINEFADEFDIELLVPEGSSIYAKEFTNLKLTERGESSSRWTTMVATKYAKVHNRVLVNLTFPLSLNSNSIVEIADVRYLEKYNGNYYDSFKFRFKMYLKAILGSRNARIIATISEFSKERIHKILGAPYEKIEVIPCGWEHINRTEEDTNIFSKFENLKLKEYYFTLGSLARHKNHKLIIKLAEKNPNDTFVIGGGVDPQIFYSDCPTESTKNLIFTGVLSDSNIKALFKNCKAFIFPSLYEGFGIPPLEALACGAQVIVSDIPVMREIFENTVHYIDPDNSALNLSSMLYDHVDDPSSVLSEYTWKKAGGRWYEIFKKYE